MKEYIISFDLSLNGTAYCIFSIANDAKFVLSYTIDTQHSSQGRKGKLKIIGNEMEMLKEKYNPKLIVIEKGFYRFAGSSEAIYMVHGITNYIFSDIDQIYIPPTTVKKNVLGKGNATKNELRDYIFKTYCLSQRNLKTLDESDAFAVGVSYFNEKNIKVRTS